MLLNNIIYDRIIIKERITREKLDYISSKKLEEIIKLKQYYFCQEWLSCRVVLNKILIEKLATNQKQNCYLWTKADKHRANKIIADCKLDKYFKDIIFDDKSDFKISIPKLQQLTKSNQFIIYENNEQFFQNQNCKIVDSIQSNLFDINGYLIG